MLLIFAFWEILASWEINLWMEIGWSSQWFHYYFPLPSSFIVKLVMLTLLHICCMFLYVMLLLLHSITLESWRYSKNKQYIFLMQNYNFRTLHTQPLHGEFKNKTWVQPCIYFLGAGIIGVFAIRYFVRSPASWYVKYKT